MAIYAQFDEAGPCLQIASNTGWSEFGDWVETLTGFQRITGLWKEGNTEDIAGLRSDLEEVLEKSPPTNKDVLSVADGLIHAIDAGGTAEVLIVTSGIAVDPEPPTKPLAKTSKAS